MTFYVSTFEVLRNVIIPSEMGKIIHHKDNGPIPIGIETFLLKQKIIEILKTFCNEKKNLLIKSTEMLVFSSFVNEIDEIEDKLIGIYNIIQNENHINEVMYFCTKEGYDLKVFNYILNKKYPHDKNWIIKDFNNKSYWTKLGFNNDGKLERECEINNQCYSCNDNNIKYYHKKSNYAFCSNECFNAFENNLKSFLVIHGEKIKN
jgi:hypothetical protein